MLPLFAAGVSDGATNPESWSRAIDRNGFGIVMAAVFVGAVLIAAGYIIYRLFSSNGIVERLFTRLDTFLTSLQTTLGATQASLSAQAEKCDEMRALHTSGPCNVADLRKAGHAFAEISLAIGDGVGVDVRPHVAKVHEVLRGE